MRALGGSGEAVQRLHNQREEFSGVVSGGLSLFIGIEVVPTSVGGRSSGRRSIRRSGGHDEKSRGDDA